MATYYAWAGNTRTTSGTPHPVTGRLNLFGDMFAFSSKKERDDFCENHYMARYESYPVKTNKREAKRLYFGGCTQVQFDEYMYYVEEHPFNNQ